jgi:Putative enzyme of poly-gamma-glutamate biosynthesis (capsule formation)
MLRRNILLFVFLSFFSLVAKKNSVCPTDVDVDLPIVSMIFCGDVMGHMPQVNAAYNSSDDSYDYNPCFAQIIPYIQRADIAVANLEVPLAEKPYSGYPRFSSPDELLDALQHAGYDVILTANNHVVDKGAKGLKRTIEQIDQRQLMRAGSYLDSLDRNDNCPLIIERKGLKIALLNTTYGTNGIAVPSPALVNLIDTAQIRNDIKKAKDEVADFIVMCIHWGVEYELKANKEQQAIAQFLADEGVHLIIGSHPHVVQNVEILYGKDSVEVPVYYSLGNAVSNQRWEHSNGGIMVSVDIHSFTKKIVQGSYLPVYVHKGKLHEKYQYHLIATPDYLENPAYYNLSTKDSTELVSFDVQTRERIEKENNRYVRLLNRIDEKTTSH